jgi:hypothetical protein
LFLRDCCSGDVVTDTGGWKVPIIDDIPVCCSFFWLLFIGELGTATGRYDDLLPFYILLVISFPLRYDAMLLEPVVEGIYSVLTVLCTGIPLLHSSAFVGIVPVLDGIVDIVMFSFERRCCSAEYLLEYHFRLTDVSVPGEPSVCRVSLPSR